MLSRRSLSKDTATTDIYTLSLHDALPILQELEPAPGAGRRSARDERRQLRQHGAAQRHDVASRQDRKSTRLNSSHSQTSYAVFCLKKKKTAPGATRPKASMRTDPKRTRLN